MKSSLQIGKTPRRFAGLTLVEMMITVAVLALLATIAYPIFTQQSQKARRADAKTALQAIAQAQERFFSINGRYTNDMVNDLNLSSGAVDTGACGGNANCPTTTGYYRITLANTDTTYTATATAIGSQAGDSKCSTLNLMQDGTQGATNTVCW